MSRRTHVIGDSDWAIVLAAGDGSRLRALTTDRDGHSTPKQFCSLEGGRTLLGQALERACSVVGPDRVVTIVAASHRRLWEPEVCRYPEVSAVEQPLNRGTAAGVLFPLLQILGRDPYAFVVLLPSDHYVRDEEILRGAILEALALARRGSGEVVLLGIPPDKAVDDYGWILPRPGPSADLPVERFIEKPPLEVSCRLLARGGLWNSAILVAQGQVLLRLFRARLPALVDAFLRAGTPPLWESEAVERLYEELDAHDFSREVLQGSESSLRVLEVPHCGWTDLGTPERVVACLDGGGARRPRVAIAGMSRPVLAKAAGKWRAVRGGPGDCAVAP